MRAEFGPAVSPDKNRKFSPLGKNQACWLNAFSALFGYGQQLVLTGCMPD